MSFSNIEILTQFQKAPPELRQDFLTKLSLNFHPSDWYYLNSLLTARSYHVDILTALPIEISLQILQYLPSAQTILLRSVSRRYNSLLTSTETCRFLAHHYFPSSTSSTESWATHYENILSRRLRFERARPSRMEIILTVDNQSLTSFCATASTLASTSGSCFVRVHLLTTSPPTLIFPPTPMLNWGRLSDIILTPSIVATISNNKCQVWDLATHATHSFRMHSEVIRASHGSGNIVAVAVSNDLLIHDAVQKKTRLFEMAFLGFTTPLSGLIFLVVHEPTHRVWVMGAAGRGDNVKATVAALCLDTAAIVVPAETSDMAIGLGALTDNGSGVWTVGKSRIHDSKLDVQQLRIDVNRTTEAVRFSSYSLTLPDEVFQADIYTPGFDIRTLNDVNWAFGHVARKIVVWEESELKARRLSTNDLGYPRKFWEAGKWVPRYVCENFVVAESSMEEEELALIRFDGVHDKVTPRYGFDSS